MAKRVDNPGHPPFEYISEAAAVLIYLWGFSSLFSFQRYVGLCI